MNIKQVILTVIMNMIFLSTFGQCSSCPAVPSCSGGNGPLYNNANINSGDFYWYDGNGDSYSVNFGGGTLVVCGNLTLSNANFNGAYKIYIAEGAKLTINSNLFLNGGAGIYNYGELVIKKDATIQNSNNVLSNCSTNSILSIYGKLSVNNSSSTFVNRGIAEINNLTIQPNGSDVICLGENSEMYLTDITNNYSYTVSAPEGQACVSYTGNALFNNPFTTYEDVNICKQPGATTSANGGWGNATVHENCTSCSVVLPIGLNYFSAFKENDYVKLEWETQTEINNDYFVLQKSMDAVNFINFAIVDGAGNSSTPIKYTYYDKSPYSGFTYYRLKQVDFDGNFSYSNIEDVYFSPIEILNIYPNPADNNITIEVASPDNFLVSVYVTNSIGQNILSENLFLEAGKQYIKLNVKHFSSGVYIFRIIAPNGELTEKEFIKK